jgi:L-serine deaminase
MIRKLIGAVIGASMAKRHKAAGGVTGAVLASAVPFVISRVSLPGMVALGVGGYVAKRYMDRGEQKAYRDPTSLQPAPVER